MNSYNSRQLTFGSYGHTLHHCQVTSPDNNWIVYDTRNEDTAIATTTRIERVNINTKEIQVLYEVDNSTIYGPGVGAVTYSPSEEKVMFIHGIENASKEKPYSMSRRTGVSVNTNTPHMKEYMDARNIIAPYTKGALRGGTHSHCWHPTQELISFTYNDEILAQNNIKTERVVGIMFPKMVEVPNCNTKDNISGKMFSVIVSEIVENATPGTNEIEKAFDECWLGDKRQLVFQCWVRDKEGRRKTEIFRAIIPSNEELYMSQGLCGSEFSLPTVPISIKVNRVTYTPKGVSELRHWLRSSPDGNRVFFLMEDEKGITQLFCHDFSKNIMNQVTFLESSIQSPFNLSPCGDKVVFLSNNSLIVCDISTFSYNVLISNDMDIYGIPNWDKTGNIIIYNKYTKDEKGGKYLQIFSVNLK
ncbi:DUF3748 domain-containing protein [Faecalibacter rhinopitheci]|uniref:DUF3748 domain-containing protein n=1 Tax=Faecalibacter rhinopitheci TaxID=2779678 RepID=A0A8J7KCA4_9FLAO|nr:DUF3748 domain-containing protein [Faecalibacter rhinopitheci]MBF0595966.1 DUF3748 domain-containing protein [Faecalibacter rhinopitheci]